MSYNSNGQTIEATNSGIFEIHPSNKFEDEGFRDNGQSNLIFPFTGNSFWWGTTQGSGVAGHQCLDFHAQDWTRLFNTCNQDFLSPIEGKVISIDDDLPENCSDNTGAGTGSGNQVTIQSNIDKTMAFKVLHLNDVNVSVGDNIETGQLIGTVGSTGEVTTGPHAHITLYKNIYVSNEIQTSTGFENVRIINLLKNGYGYNNTSNYGCNNIKNYHSASFDFSNNSFSGRMTSSSEIFSDLENSEYTVFIPEDNIKPNIRIFNLNGTEVRRMDNVTMNAVANGSTRNININEFSSGIYIITVQSKTKQYSHKIVKK